MKLLLPLRFVVAATVGAIASSTGQASACSLPMQDLSERLDGALVPAFEMVDPNSEEPIRRYVRSQADGSMVVLEQKHCEIENISILMMSPEAAPTTANRDAMAAALKATDMWNKWFDGTEPGAALETALANNALKEAMDKGTAASIAANDAFSAQGESSEVLLGFTPLEDTGSFRSITSLSISVGGL